MHIGDRPRFWTSHNGDRPCFWTSYHRPSLINGSGQTSRFWYTPDRRRWKQVATYPSTGTETTISIGGLVEKLTRGTVTEYRHLIEAGSVQIIATRSASGQSVRYLSTDALGSAQLILNASGAVLANLSFAAFGNRRGSAWQGIPSSADQTQIRNATRHAGVRGQGSAGSAISALTFPLPACRFPPAWFAINHRRRTINDDEGVRSSGLGVSRKRGRGLTVACSLFRVPFYRHQPTTRNHQRNRKWQGSGDSRKRHQRSELPAFRLPLPARPVRQQPALLHRSERVRFRGHPARLAAAPGLPGPLPNSAGD